jgi:hypothetical protein
MCGVALATFKNKPQHRLNFKLKRLPEKTNNTESSMSLTVYSGLLRSSLFQNIIQLFAHGYPVEEIAKKN